MSNNLPSVKVERPKLPVGRKPDYNEELCSRAFNLLRIAGTTEKAAYIKLGIPKSTYYKWKKEHPEFAEAIASGKDAGEVEAGTVAWGMACGAIKGDTNALKFVMQNLYGWGKDAQIGGVSNTQINIGSMAILQDKTTEELIEYIQGVAHDVKDVIDVSDFIVDD